MSKEAIEFISKIAIAIIGGLFGSYMTRLLNRNREKVTLTFDLHKEFNSFEMQANRKKADTLIKKFPMMNYEDLHYTGDENWATINVVLTFFQRLSQGVKYNQVKTKLTLELLSESFYYWYYMSFEKALVPLNWKASVQIKYLADWFENKLDKETHFRLKQEMTEKLSLRMEFEISK